MIWLAGFGLVIVTLAYALSPFLAASNAAGPDTRAEILADLRALPANADPAHRTALERRLLDADKAVTGTAGVKGKLWIAGISAILLLGTFGIYSQIGTPNFVPETRQVATPQSNLDSIIAQIEARLADDPEDATGWYILGRTLVLRERFDEGFAAYERSLELNPNPDVDTELASARTYAARVQSGPSAEDIAAAQDLSTSDRDEMILGMVESLSARLAADPNDPQGWERLLRSRRVLGQTEAAKADMIALRAALPNQADEIIAATGWASADPE